MNVSVNWVRELAPGLEGDGRALADRLTMAAVAVDAVEPIGAELDGVLVGRVLEAEPHPNADRLTLCAVDAGGGDPIQVVCGAPVVESGALYPYVPPGATLPGGFRIETRKIRGRESHGMLCSEHELGLGRDKGGILRLSDDLEPGRPLAEALGLPDARLVLDLTPNRVDLACHVGVARELAEEGEAGLSLRPAGAQWSPEWVDGRTEAEAAEVGVRIEDADRCRRYLGAVIRGVRVGPSPAWLAGRLRAVGLRPVNNVVDATNYVLMELNQPIHAFDLATLRGPEIRVRAAAAGETIRTLDGEERTLGPEVTVIADRDRPVAVAGVMGGEETEVTERTTDVFLECASFGPRWVRRSARALGLGTEASYRFERGIDEAGLERALARCAALVLATAGGEAEAAASRVGGPAPEPVEVPLRPGRVGRVLGIAPGPFELRRMLAPLGFRALEDGAGGEGDGEAAGAAHTAEAAEAVDSAGASGGGTAAAAGPADPASEPLRFLVPGWRTDVRREIDLIEEVARRHGYDRFPDEERRFRASAIPDDPDWARAGRMRRFFRGRGFLEARSSPFVPEAQGGGRAEVRVRNPLSAVEAHLRAGLVPVLLRRLEHNLARGHRDVRLFEVGTAFRLRGEEAREGLFAGGSVVGPVHEELRAAAVLTGRRRPPHWSEEEPDADVWDLKGLAAELAEGLFGGRVEPREGPDPEDGPGGPWLTAEAFRILRGTETVGVGGRVAGEAIDAPPWAAPVWALELRLAAVEPAPVPTHAELSAYPAVRRDLAVTVPREVRAGAMEAAIRDAAPATLESVRLFDVYEGEGIEEGRRSLAWTFRFRSPERTLTDEEADEALGRIVSALEERFDARIRTS